jgi:hypothetical protein
MTVWRMTSVLTAFKYSISVVSIIQSRADVNDVPGVVTTVWHVFKGLYKEVEERDLMWGSLHDTKGTWLVRVPIYL